MLVLVRIAVLVSADTSEERDGFACIPRSTACKVRVDDNCGKGDCTESITPFNVPVELASKKVRLEVVVEAVIGSLPVDILSEVLAQEEVIDMVLNENTRCISFAEDVRTDTSQEKSISSSSRHFDFFYLIIIIIVNRLRWGFGGFWRFFPLKLRLPTRIITVF